MEIRLAPSGALRWEPPEEGEEAAKFRQVHKAFESDWREGLFLLAAERVDASGLPTVRYWQGVAERFITTLCHLPETASVSEVREVTDREWDELSFMAPPMIGGEYLSGAMLSGIWTALKSWCEKEVLLMSSLGAFLRTRAPLWHQIGRVCFHLAENKANPDKPFAFMATYVPGLGVSGRERHQPLRNALQEYAGARNRQALVKLLSPVQAASDRCAWVKCMVESGEIYQALAWIPNQAYQLLLSVPALEESGLVVRLPDWWKKRARPQVSVTLGNKAPSALGLDAILQLDIRVALGEESLSDEEIQSLLSGEDGLVLIKGQWVEVDRERLQEAIQHWEELRRHVEQDGVTFIEGMRMLAGASITLHQGVDTEEDRTWIHVEAGQALREILAGLRDPSRLVGEEDMIGLEGELRPYQKDGVAWLRFLADLRLGACLADDMGLGKTIQVLATLLARRSHPDSRASLLVVPASLLANWRVEAQRFAPSLKLAFLHPAETDKETLTKIKKAPAKHLASVDLAVTSYSMLIRQTWIEKMEWGLVILDEAQAIKNPGTSQTRAVKRIKAQSRVVLTGTPVENRLGDLWSIFDFLNPGLLGSAKDFQSFIKRLGLRQEDQFGPLRRLVTPYILRRMKTDRSIIEDLPDKIETTRYCALTRTQARLYQQVVERMKAGLQVSDRMKRRALVLQTLMRLKQVCNHPSQLTGDAGYMPGDSGKFQRLAEICSELAERQERVLIFTQFREIIDPLSAHLAGVFGRSGLTLHGGTSVSKRKGIVDHFQREDGPPFMLLSLKAGGIGLNLTAANHVIHFDRWWNPAVEDQATDRAFRIGQRKNVLVHKFVTSGTVEERIDAMIIEKRTLAREVLSQASEVDVTGLSDDELVDLVRLDIRRAVE